MSVYSRYPGLVAAIVAATFLAAGCTSLHAPGAVVAPNESLKAEGIPPIPAALVDKVAPYTEFRPRRVSSWHPKKREIVVAARAGNTTQLHLVANPTGELKRLTDFPDPVRFGFYLPNRPDSLLFDKDTGGNEQTQIYRMDALAKEPALLTDPQRRHSLADINHARTRVLIESTDLDKTGRREDPTTDITLLDPLEPANSRMIATLPGTGWFSHSFSFDDARIALGQYKSANQSIVWTVDVATGARTQVFPAANATPAEPFFTSEIVFSRDGKGLFLATNRDGEFLRLAYLDLASGKLEYFGDAEPWDVQQIALSPDGKRLAVITNEAGIGVLRLYDADTRKPLPRPRLPVGTVDNAIWHENSNDLALNVNSARSPGDVYAIDVDSLRIDRWTEMSVYGLDAGKFAVQEPISWQSFDGRTIQGFITRPPRSFSGPRPVVLSIHGGPESQARPGFMGRWNYFVDNLGIAIIEPNVRGSSGYGKTFLALDDGMKREDSVKDIGALLDWIATQPDLDPKRVVVEGGSYGGYMSLAVAIKYGDRIAGAIDTVGIANFVTFLTNTESYRRDLRRVEYGDERDPAMREFLTKISPVGNADRIKKPLFVVQGKNDPRVPYTEAEQIVAAARKNNATVWYLLADNEGHGFARRVNVDYLFYAMITFLEATIVPRP